MKYLLLIAVFVGSFASFAQDETCNQLPMAKVDKKAEVKSDLTKMIQDDMPSELEKEEHTAVVKIYVDCKGAVDKSRIQESKLTDEHQKWLLNVIDKTEWNAAEVGDKKVTSTVFVTVYLKNGHARISIQ